MPKIKIEKELYEKVKQKSEDSGYSSVDEFVTHIFEQIVNSRKKNDLDDKDVLTRLQGLGYIS